MDQESDMDHEDMEMRSNFKLTVEIHPPRGGSDVFAPT